MIETFRHEPECLHDDKTYGLRGLCICDEIKRAEKRLLADISKSDTVLAAVEQSWNDALNAARESVMLHATAGQGAAVPPREFVHTHSVLAAIETLRNTENNRMRGIGNDA